MEDVVEKDSGREKVNISWIKYHSNFQNVRFAIYWIGLNQFTNFW